VEKGSIFYGEAGEKKRVAFSCCMEYPKWHITLEDLL